MQLRKFYCEVCKQWRETDEPPISHDDLKIDDTDEMGSCCDDCWQYNKWMTESPFREIFRDEEIERRTKLKENKNE